MRVGVICWNSPPEPNVSPTASTVRSAPGDITMPTTTAPITAATAVAARDNDRRVRLW